MKYAAIKKIVNKSLAAQICTGEGIKRFVEVAVQGEINAGQFDGVLERMRFEKKIALLENGAFAAYFPANRLPTSFFRAGGGRINAVYDNPQAGLPVRIVSLEVPEDSLTLDEDEEIEVAEFFTDDDLRQIENLAAENFSNKEIAARLDVSERLFAVRARFDLPTRRAIADGHKRRRNEAERVAAVRAERAAERASQPKPPKVKPRVCDFRPMPAPIAAEPVETMTTEPLPTVERRVIERPPRLCACGEPLGARVKECKNCRLKQKGSEAGKAKLKTETPTDRKIKEILKNENFDREKLLTFTLDLFLESSPAPVKEKFLTELLEELEAANQMRNEENI